MASNRCLVKSCPEVAPSHYKYYGHCLSGYIPLIRRLLSVTLSSSPLFNLPASNVSRTFAASSNIQGSCSIWPSELPHCISTRPLPLSLYRLLQKENSLSPPPPPSLPPSTLIPVTAMQAGTATPSSLATCELGLATEAAD